MDGHSPVAFENLKSFKIQMPMPFFSRKFSPSFEKSFEFCSRLCGLDWCHPLAKVCFVAVSFVSWRFSDASIGITATGMFAVRPAFLKILSCKCAESLRWAASLLSCLCMSYISRSHNDYRPVGYCSIDREQQMRCPFTAVPCAQWTAALILSTIPVRRYMQHSARLGSRTLASASLTSTTTSQACGWCCCHRAGASSFILLPLLVAAKPCS